MINAVMAPAMALASLSACSSSSTPYPLSARPTSSEDLQMFTASSRTKVE